MNKQKGRRIFTVNHSGAGSHKDIASAMKDAEENSDQITQIKITPKITIDNFELPNNPGGGL